MFADLTGRNPNVYYELGVSHSFRLPVIILVDHPDSLSFDTQNERVIPIGDSGAIGVSQADRAKSQLRAVLQIVLQEGYEPDNIVTAVAASRSLDALTPDNPIASELAVVRDSIEQLSARLLRPERRQVESPGSSFQQSFKFGHDLTSSDIKVGNVLVHRQWGPGRVSQIVGTRQGATIVMDFPKLGRKRLLLRYAPLRRSNDDERWTYDYLLPGGEKSED